MTDKQPACLTLLMKCMYSIKDAVYREGFVEAIRYCGDAQVAVRNEIDWTYNSDQDLPYILEFLDELTKAISVAIECSAACREDLKKTIIEELEGLLTLMPKVTANLATHTSPDECLDDMEVAHRQRKYLNITVEK